MSRHRRRAEEVMRIDDPVRVAVIEPDPCEADGRRRRAFAVNDDDVGPLLLVFVRAYVDVDARREAVRESGRRVQTRLRLPRRETRDELVVHGEHHVRPGALVVVLVVVPVVGVGAGSVGPNQTVPAVNPVAGEVGRVPQPLSHRGRPAENPTISHVEVDVRVRPAQFGGLRAPQVNVRAANNRGKGEVIL